MTEHVVHGHTPLRLGAGLQQVGKSLRLYQIHPVIDKGPTGKFAGLRQPHASKRTKDFEHRIDHRGTTVYMELSHVFTGSAQWAGHPEDESLINDLLGLGTPQLPDAGPPG